MDTAPIDDNISPHYISRDMRRTALLYVLAALLGGCAAAPTNPSFPVTATEAHKAIDEMQHDPVKLQRPLVLVGGFLDPDISPAAFTGFFESVSDHPLIIRVPIGFCNSFDDCRNMLIAAVDAACPPKDPTWTREVDVVGASLGGLVARYAAAPSPDPAHPRRLRIARLFTISSPLAGARLAEIGGINSFYRDIQPGSAFLNSLAAQDAHATYQLYPYVYLGDPVIGDQYAAPPGKSPFWLSNNTGFPDHWAIMTDQRVLADIARRLRDEPAFSHLPAAPLPSSAEKHT